MEFGFDVRGVLRQEMTLVNMVDRPRHGTVQQLREIVDRLGAASAKAQKLPGVITTADKLRISRHRMYVLADLPNNRVLGFVKTGEKKLFLHDNLGRMKEVTPTCVLDFYVHESCQRQGCGRKLFDAFVKAEQIHPFKLAIDKPSKKCFGFLAKHYGLTDYRPQSNNYVVFRQFWEPTPADLPLRDNHRAASRGGGGDAQGYDRDSGPGGSGGGAARPSRTAATPSPRLDTHRSSGSGDGITGPRYGHSSYLGIRWGLTAPGPGPSQRQQQLLDQAAQAREAVRYQHKHQNLGRAPPSTIRMTGSLFPPIEPRGTRNTRRQRFDPYAPASPSAATPAAATPGVHGATAATQLVPIGRVPGPAAPGPWGNRRPVAGQNGTTNLRSFASGSTIGRFGQHRHYDAPATTWY